MLIKTLFAFLIGGMFCVIAQILIDKTSLTPAKILVLYVVSGVFIGAVGLYEPIFKLAGCGASLPLVGFGGNIAKGVKKAINEMGFFGILGGAFSAAAIGCTVSLLLGLIMSLFSRGKSKKL